MTHYKLMENKYGFRVYNSRNESWSVFIGNTSDPESIELRYSVNSNKCGKSKKHMASYKLAVEGNYFDILKYMKEHINKVRMMRALLL